MHSGKSCRLSPFQKPARRLNRTQPAISASINNLENLLGIKLFQRQGMRLHPVPEAHYLLAEACKILDQLEVSRRTMNSIRNLEHGSLNVLCMPGPSVFFMPDLIDKFIEKRSAVKVSLFTKSSSNIKRLISAQQYDVGFAEANLQEPEFSNLINYEHFTAPCFCALHHQDPLCKKNSISADDLHQKPMAALYADHTTRKQTEAAICPGQTQNSTSALRHNTLFHFLPLLKKPEPAPLSIH